MYPTIFTLGTANLGRHTRRGAGILVMGVSGGAIMPPIQGAIADAVNTRVSMVVPLAGFAYVLGYVTFHWLTNGRHILRVKGTSGGLNDTPGAGVAEVHYDNEKEIKYEEAELSRSS